MTEPIDNYVPLHPPQKHAAMLYDFYDDVELAIKQYSPRDKAIGRSFTKLELEHREKVLAILWDNTILREVE